MSKFDRRSALTIGLAAASAAMVKPVAAQTTEYKDTTVAPGVVMRVYGDEPSMVPGYKTVSMSDFIFQPGSKTAGATPMMNPMVCHITEGEIRVVQDGSKTFTAKKNFVWTCNKGTTEQGFNDGNVVAVMRSISLKV